MGLKRQEEYPMPTKNRAPQRSQTMLGHRLHDEFRKGEKQDTVFEKQETASEYANERRDPRRVETSS